MNGEVARVKTAMLIDYYKAIEASSAKMLEAAKAENWSEVVRHEGTCAILIEQLRHRAKTEQLDVAARAEKSKIMLKILHNDAQIRYLAEPWLSQLERDCLDEQGYLH
ncbi:MAG: flagellar protein FliT [Burkholderiales bacterium PBB4]|nr:MAG: flagellar protein FliT [Burkholderiales bacterium PBB4]